MDKIRKNDTIKVLAGKDKGKTGKVLHVFPKNNRAVVEGVNFIKRHTRKTQNDQQGGIVEKESPIHVSNLVLLCKACNRPTRVGATKLGDGTKTRFCKRCKEIIS
ncbi:MAG: 50S ribosomal protein L24 [Candidatus Omnitrophica bacterium]|nr:50S ribosomal protein L24 [Candidatus Omnitrophota bacterium]